MKRILLVTIALFVLAGTAQADTLASWDVYTLCDSGTNTTVAGTDSDYVEAMGMSMGAGLSRYNYTGYYESKGWGGTDADDYVQMGFTVADGYEVTLESLVIGLRSSNAGPGTMGIYTSLDSYADAVFTYTMPGSTWVNVVIDLSDLGTITDDFTIRFYEIGDTQADLDGSTSNSAYFAISEYYNSGTYTDVQFTGSVAASAVPVPGALWLMITGVLGLVGFSRKRS